MTDNSDDTVFSNPPSAKGVVLSPGMMVNENYQIVSLMGTGGMGAVYRVKQVFLGKEFALKILNFQNQSDISVRRFQQEARTASQLQHPNLVEVHDFGMLGESQPYLVMDLVEGQTLSEILKKEGALSVDYVLGLSIQISLGLIYAHEKGVVHRDIKPGNIMLLHPGSEVVEGTVKVVDFGIAKLMQSDDGEIQELTKTGEIFGSPTYMSPEQCRGSQVDKRSDIYSLGSVIFECLTGSPPFLGDNAMSTMLKRLSEEPISLKEGSLGRDFPLALENIVRKMLALEPDDRYQDLRAVMKDLAALQQPEIAAAITSTIEKTPDAVELSEPRVSISKRAWLAVAVAIVSCLVTAVVDRFVVLPNLIAEDTKARIHSAEENLDEVKDVGAAEYDRTKFEDLDKSIGKDPIGNYPIVRTRKGPTGEKQEFLFFPLNCGKIATGKERKKNAEGEIALPNDAQIVLKLSRAASSDENTLKNLTHLKFRRIDYGGSVMVKQQQIAILERIENLEQVGLEDCDINSLKPLYNSKTLERLEVGGTYVPSSEILKVRRLGVLENLTFGPVSDPAVVFDALAKTNKINNLSYKGARIREARGRGLAPRDVAALSKLTSLGILNIETCPKFDDIIFKKLLPLQKLHQIKIKDCAITPRSIPTFLKFKNLEVVQMTTTGWSKADIQQLKNKCVVVESATRSQREEERRSNVEGSAGLLKY
ncbi:MAG: hypothetical protein C0469_12915 [Cyanobacteria bacterium DS2.3.42]|nr:hypothetical protein [Cyanobacteria bacterium DS2.3.42]